MQVTERLHSVQVTVQNKAVQRHGVGEEGREKVQTQGLQGTRDHTSEDAGFPCPPQTAALGSFTVDSYPQLS